MEALPSPRIRYALLERGENPLLIWSLRVNRARATLSFGATLCVVLISVDCLFINFDLLYQSMFGRVFCFELPARIPPHLGNICIMGPKPFRFPCEVFRIARIEVEPRLLIIYNLLHRAKSRAKHWNTASKRLGDNHWKAFKP